MIVENTKSSTILVLDDHYAVESSSSDEFYGRNDFERDFGALPFKFVYSPAWDDGTRQYTVAAALRAVANTKPQGILLDVMFDRMTGNDSKSRLGVDILRELSRKYPEIPVVMMTSVPRNDLWTECARLGAVDYLTKPMNEKLLAQTLHRYVGVGMKNWLVGQNKLFLDALNLAAMAAEGKRTPVMITGETGSGKELVASFVHRHGRGAETPFKTIFFPGITSDLQPDALFGHSKGAFSGADREMPGAFLTADGGVIFLDELGDLTKESQTMLLRVADSGEVTRLGDGRTSKVNVQIVSATNADLAKKIKENDFRYDLWARLNGMHVVLPSLEQRRDDIPMLLRHLLRCEALSRERAVPGLPESLEVRLRDHLWQTNVRGLLAYVQRVFDLSGDREPDEAVFNLALTQQQAVDGPGVEKGQDEGKQVQRPMDTAEAENNLKIAVPHFGNAQDWLQHLRLEELAILQRALEQTRDALTGAPSRAKAAALLKRKPKCNTNEFDRWVKTVWDELTPESCKQAQERFPELMLALKSDVVKD